MKKSTEWQGRFIALVVADFAGDWAVALEFGVSVPADFIHFVEPSQVKWMLALA